VLFGEVDRRVEDLRGGVNNSEVLPVSTGRVVNDTREVNKHRAQRDCGRAGRTLKRVVGVLVWIPILQILRNRHPVLTPDRRIAFVPHSDPTVLALCVDCHVSSLHVYEREDGLMLSVNELDYWPLNVVQPEEHDEVIRLHLEIQDLTSDYIECPSLNIANLYAW